MRVSLTLLVTMAVILAILLPEMEAASTRKGKAARRPRGRSQVRARAGRFAGKRLRRGRQEEVDPEAEADLNAVDGEVAGDEAMEELYNGCDWKTNIGGFLNFCKWRKWCADNQGITDFGPYGGVPTSCPPEAEGSGDEAAGDDPEAAAADAEAVEETVAEARRARARRGRKVNKKSFKNKNKRPAPRRSKSKKFAKKSRSYRG